MELIFTSAEELDRASKRFLSAQRAFGEKHGHDRPTLSGVQQALATMLGAKDYNTLLARGGSPATPAKPPGAAAPACDLPSILTGTAWRDGVYHVDDQSVGFVWECAPHALTGTREMKPLEELLRLPLPESAVMQFILLADDRVEPHLDAYLKNRSGEAAVMAARSYCAALAKGHGPVPTRNFRLLVTLKMPAGEMLREYGAAVRELLVQAQLFPVPCNPETLAATRQWIGGGAGVEGQAATRTAHMRCLTPTAIPPNPAPWQTAALFGKGWGISDDSNQIPGPFLYTLNITYRPDGEGAQPPLGLQRGASRASLGERERDLARRDSRSGRLITPIIWTWGASTDAADASAARTRRIWESEGYALRLEESQLPELLAAATPLGRQELHGRGFIAGAAGAACTAALLPTSADFAGFGYPDHLFVGRKGQIATLSLYDKTAPNHNLLITAGAGSGKAYFLNTLVQGHCCQGGTARILTVGNAPGRLAKERGARVVSFAAPFSLNPFTSVGSIDEEIDTLCAIVLQAARPVRPQDEEAGVSLVKLAIRTAWSLKGRGAWLGDVATALETVMAGITSSTIRDAGELTLLGLKEFCAAHRDWFSGPGGLDSSSDPLVYFDLLPLAESGTLMEAVALTVMAALSRDTHTCKSRRLVLLDDAWQYLARCPAGPVNELFRRCTARRAGVGVVTDSLMDLDNPAGRTVLANTAFKLHFESRGFAQARAAGLLECSDEALELLQSVRSNRPRYLEFFVSSPLGSGVLRQPTDPVTSIHCSTDRRDIEEIAQLMEMEGKSYPQALEAMAQRYY